MIRIGQINTLTVSKQVSFGIYLDGGETWGEILLPKRYAPNNIDIGDKIDVLIYFDSEDRIIATTETAKAFVNEFAYLQVVDINFAGAFLDWGLSKDILVPYVEQATKMRKQAYYLVFIYLDPESERITASSKIDEFIGISKPDYKTNQAVHITVIKETDLGYKVIVDHQHYGLLYRDQVFQELKTGMQLKGFVQKVRDDQKIDVSIRSNIKDELDQLSTQILDRLHANHGVSKIHEKTDPKVIYQLYKASKKNYKRALSKLYKARLIEIKPDGIYLVESGENKN